MRKHLITFCVGAALALTGCPESPKPGTPTAPAGGAAPAAAPAGGSAPAAPAPAAPAAAPASDTVPGYEDVKAGQKYVYEMGGTMKGERTDEIVSKTDAEVKIKMTTKMKIEGVPDMAPTVNEMAIPIKATKGDATAPKTDAPKSTGKETIKVAGIDFECEIFETDTAGVKSKTWMAKKYPFMIKSDAGGMTTTLKDIQK